MSMDPKIVYPGCNTRMEIELAYDLGRREGQVEWLREQLTQIQNQLKAVRQPGVHVTAASGLIRRTLEISLPWQTTTAVHRRALAVSEPWEAPTK